MANEKQKQDSSLNLKSLKYLVVGSGFFGAVIAERIAQGKNEQVVIIEKRAHLGGNSYSEVDQETGIEYHKYGSHIFHTSIEEVWDYINRFCTFNNYRHKVLTRYQDKVYQMPINLATINSLYGLNLCPVEAKTFLETEAKKANITSPANLEQKAISLIGKSLYDAFIKEYTMKQWGTDPRELAADIITRLPVRYNYQNEYFDNVWQGIPMEGYGKIFERMLTHKNIEVFFNTDFFDIRHLVPKDCLVIYSGPIDCFFDYKFGLLGWRSLVFEREVHLVSDFQGTSVMNYAGISVPYTRIHEPKHFHPERKQVQDKTLIFKEYSKAAVHKDEFYYPINTTEDRNKLKLYHKEAKKRKNLILGGRLGGYQYLDMDQVINSALITYDTQIKNH